MNRDAALARLNERFDLLVVGGGATGLGTAVDAASRGYRTALIEGADFASATSSRSTKLIHGGVRYLAGGRIGLVREALEERTNLLHNAPHLVRDLPFIVPVYRWIDLPYYAAGLKMYDLLAGNSNLPRSTIVTAQDALARIPGLNGRGLRAAVMYHDAQFDDARLALTLARTAVDCGATVANYMRATRFLYERGAICGVLALDRESGRELEIRARVVINATGIFVDLLRALDAAAGRLLTHSRGSHIVVPAHKLGTTTHAIVVPKTNDGRVIFVTPWREKVVIGTTDVPTTDVELEPRPTRDEVNYILRTVNPYLAQPVVEADVVAVFAGLRPLVNRKTSATSKLSREHAIAVSSSGLVTIAGGKWTTYRKMAEDVVDVAAARADLPRVSSLTARMTLRGATREPGASDALGVYGSDAKRVLEVADQRSELRGLLHPGLPYIRAEVVYAARHEMARTVDDVLARRTRALFLDAGAALECAPIVARLLAGALRRDEAWQGDEVRRFAHIAAGASLH